MIRDDGCKVKYNHQTKLRHASVVERLARAGVSLRQRLDLRLQHQQRRDAAAKRAGKYETDGLLLKHFIGRRYGSSAQRGAYPCGGVISNVAVVTRGRVPAEMAESCSSLVTAFLNESSTPTSA
jgi:hypothetical protein